jgi:hypothetical protein
MDASDIIRTRNANTQFKYLSTNILSVQAGCSSDACLKLTGCAPFQYTSYAQKNLLKQGASDLNGS